MTPTDLQETIKPEIFAGLSSEAQFNVRSGYSSKTTIESIIRVVFTYFDIPFEYKDSISRKREFVLARQIAMYLCTVKTPETLSKIGKYFGGKGHCTVLYSVGTVNDLIDTDKHFSADITIGLKIF